MAPLEIEAANSRNRTGSYKVVPTTRDRYQPFSRAFHEPARKLASTKRGGRDHATLSSKFCSSSVVHASEAGNAPTNLMGSRGRTTNSLSTLASELRKVNTKKTIQREGLALSLSVPPLQRSVARCSRRCGLYFLFACIVRYVPCTQGKRAV